MVFARRAPRQKGIAFTPADLLVIVRPKRGDVDMSEVNVECVSTASAEASGLR
jgi:hypothetical protein